MGQEFRKSGGRLSRIIIVALAAITATAGAEPDAAAPGESGVSWIHMYHSLNDEFTQVYKESPFSTLSRDYFARFSRDPEARLQPAEIEITDDWHIVLNEEAAPLSRLMADHLADSLDEAMDVPIQVKTLETVAGAGRATNAIVLLDSGGGRQHIPGSFTIRVGPGRITVHGRDPAGVRDGIVRLADRIGLRQAPFLETGETHYAPRLSVRLGSVPLLGSHRDLVFMGFNAVLLGWHDLYALSTSDAIPELIPRRKPSEIDQYIEAARTARRYGLKTYLRVNTKSKFPEDHPVFKAHPELRGSRTWKADGEFILCTEHPTVRRFLCESVAGLFRDMLDLDGVVIIIGGEGFYHCFMRPYGVEKGHTDCTRCEPLGPDVVVANMCNALAGAVREVNPSGEVIAWPYSAAHVWSSDRSQTGFIEKLRPGTAIFTEIEKDETVEKPEGVKKLLWDYSIDLIGPGERAREQIAACRGAGIPIYMKSEPELAFEAPGLPHVPCLDRWLDRAEALASCGAGGAWVFPAFVHVYGTSAAESSKYLWWTPVPNQEDILNRLAARIAGHEAGPRLRAAWKYVSRAIEWSPVIPSYYVGPYYLGPAHPMMADPAAEVPPEFYGYFFYYAEIDDTEGMKKRPTFLTSPIYGTNMVHERFYREMERLLGRAVRHIEHADPIVPERHRVMFEAEASPIRWFYLIARTEANFYTSCRLREQVLALAERPQLSEAERQDARMLYEQWRNVLLDEQHNARAALPVMENDPRLNFRYGGDHSFTDGAEMIRVKLTLIDHEINTFLPSLLERIERE
jgi:hypothetical protein